MASAIIATRNDTNWSTTSSLHHHHQNKSQMGKFPFHNPNPNPNFNPNSFSRKLISPQIHSNVVDDQSIDRLSFSHYVNFDISSLSKPELRKLKSQLISELDRVRTLSNQINPRKRQSSFPSNNHKRPKLNNQASYVASGNVMKLCANVLRKLSNQKAGMWFNSPVDAIGMGLHDYHTVINQPMDLGTIRDKLDKRVYNSPEDFAEDVRLTYNNALRYNPKGHEVNTFAGQYLALFERWFPAIMSQFEAEKQEHLKEEEVVVVVDEVEEEEVRVCSSSNFPSLKPELKPIVASPPPVLVQETVVSTMPVVERVVERRRLPKPKAKDPNKREMSSEEKRKLGDGLQNLPEEKMMQVIQIIRKRNGDLTQDGDEIELDIEAVDKETLWELDRFVGNYKKMVSKIQRQGLLGLESDNNNNNDTVVGNVVGDVNQVKKVGGGGDVGEEDVDIGDEMPVNNFPPLEIDKDDDRQQSGSSSSSGSDDSSSSDSSGSSSGSDSDVDDAQSIDNESKNFQH